MINLMQPSPHRPKTSQGDCSEESQVVHHPINNAIHCCLGWMRWQVTINFYSAEIIPASNMEWRGVQNLCYKFAIILFVT